MNKCITDIEKQLEELREEIAKLNMISDLQTKTLDIVQDNFIRLFNKMTGDNYPQPLDQ